MKERRQRAILTLVATRPVHSQEELVALLERQGFEVTQATVSRDIRELRLTKVPITSEQGEIFKYVIPSAAANYVSRLHRAMAELATTITGSGNLIMIHTGPGGAMMLASAIDEAAFGRRDAVRQTALSRSQSADGRMSRVILAYSGGLDTSVLLKKLVLEGHEVVAMTADLGESDAVAGPAAQAALDAVRSKALALGAYDAVLIDARERFISEYALVALHANALYEDVYPLSAALSRPLIAELLVENAHTYGADVVAHGCTGKGNDQVRIELAVRALDPALTCRAPLRESPLSRPDAIVFARENGVPVSHSVGKPYSIDANLWGRSIEAGVLEDPWNAPPEDVFAWTAPAALQPPVAQEIVVEFAAGLPSCEGRTTAALVAELNAIGGRHGVGRIDLVEDRVVGFKSREVYESPAATILIAAHRALERLALTRDELRFKAFADRRYAELIYDGLWMQPLRNALDAFNHALAPRMTGEVRLQLHRGNCVVTGVRSPYGLYREHVATYGRGDAFDHHAASGFIALHALPLEAYARAVKTEAIAT
jgi:argininosuccinate synthase